ncbi:hypothetical protein RHSIM_Rhsim07G0118200 [Rhododendron simsii]|uniref:MSP domain-containing protein n=1 Tax=Rhododendron simsii TaxID=118357 RepID=A0A834LH57_RHOSS|nr:hypothetical protein RHSIM_Rhsim07G0118200 [Rhododendron simsii]
MIIALSLHSPPKNETDGKKETSTPARFVSVNLPLWFLLSRINVLQHYNMNFARWLRRTEAVGEIKTVDRAKFWPGFGSRRKRGSGLDGRGGGALCTIPRNPKLCHPKTLGFSAFVSRRPFPLDSTRLSTSRVTVNAFGPSLDPVILAKTSSNRSFIVRAESNPEGEGTIENAEENEAVDSEASEAEAGVETKDAAVVKEPRKPQIKLGDIMGILNKRAVEASDDIRPIPDLRTGDIIELKMRVQETKRRLSVYKVELEKQSYCDLKVANNTEHHVAFKVKTTSPKKYFVRPNSGVIQPWDSSVIRGPTLYFVKIFWLDMQMTATEILWLFNTGTDRHFQLPALCVVTLQAQREYPPDMECKDKFLLQSVIVPPQTEIDELSQDTFNRESGKTIEERKLRVVYISPQAALGNVEDEALMGFKQSPEYSSMRSSSGFDDNQGLQQLKEERDTLVRQTQQLQQELWTRFHKHTYVDNCQSLIGV